MSAVNEPIKNDFIRQIIREDLAQGKVSNIVTRFPPEPNGYLHLGHVKAICTNFSIAEEFGGECNLRFDDTNPLKEDQEYIDSIKCDIHWLGFEWSGEPRYASGYFDRLYANALQLIKQGDAYVDRQTPEQMKLGRGSFTEVGTDSPFRDTGVEENLAWFEQMKNGELAEGSAVLRAKIDMSSPNMVMRDPALYRIMKQAHHQTGDAWCIYPMYDLAHPLSDAIEGVTHSLCTLEFEEHRPLYDWLLDKLSIAPRPYQYEFARLNVEGLITSKRQLKTLVDSNSVQGWDDPRMPTISGMRRRGYTPEGLRDFCERVGLNKAGGTVDPKLLDYCVRQSLEDKALRAMVVLKPLKVTLSNFEALDEGEVLTLTQPNHPNRPELGEREIPLTKTIYIDQADFELVPPPKYRRLTPGSEVRLRNAHVIRCDEHILDANGEVVELICSIDTDTLGKNPEGRKVKGVIHWVSADQGVPVEVRVYESLFLPEPDAAGELVLNPESLTVLEAVGEPSIKDAAPETHYQFEREAFFVSDQHDHRAEKPVFNRVIELRDSYKP